MSPFQSITLDEYRLFLQHLVALDQLAQMDEGTLIVGMKGEQLTKHYHFYAIFANEPDCRVLAGTQEVGTIQKIPAVDEVIGLAGYAWQVISVDQRRRTVHVERAKGVVKPGWLTTGSLRFHRHVMLRLRQVLQEETVYTYLSPLAQQRLSLARDLVRRSAWLHCSVIPLAEGHFIVFPWTGSRIYRTLLNIFEHIDWYSTGNNSHYYIEIVYHGNAADVLAELRLLSPQVPDLVSTLVTELKDMQLWQGKYDYLTPRTLLEKAYICDVLDVPGTMEWLATCP